MMKILLVYFSRTGYTKSVALQIARGCNADLEAIEEIAGRDGWLGYVHSASQAMLHRNTPIRPAAHMPADYDLVVIGTPIWAWTMASPVRAYINRYRGQFRQLAFFCTCGGSGQAKVLSELAHLCGKPAQAGLALTDAEINSNKHYAAIKKFVAALHNGSRAAERVRSRARRRAQTSPGV